MRHGTGDELHQEEGMAEDCRIRLRQDHSWCGHVRGAFEALQDGGLALDVGVEEDPVGLGLHAQDEGELLDSAGGSPPHGQRGGEVGVPARRSAVEAHIHLAGRPATDRR